VALCLLAKDGYIEFDNTQFHLETLHYQANLQLWSQFDDDVGFKWLSCLMRQLCYKPSIVGPPGINAEVDHNHGMVDWSEVHADARSCFGVGAVDDLDDLFGEAETTAVRGIPR
jgi:hypothetical protein